MVKSQPKLVKAVLHVTLLLCVCFVAFAIYSPLHIHNNGQCSLNNAEHQIADAITPAIELPQPVSEAIATLVEQSIAGPITAVFAQTSRGPPTVSYS